MVKVEIPKTEYEQLKKQAEAYRGFAAKFFESIIQDPIDQVVVWIGIKSIFSLK